MNLSAAHARQLDAQDPLAAFRERFVITDPELIYLDGNSLGRMPIAAAELAADLVQRQWGDRLIRSWNEGWWEAPQRIGAKIARLIGAHPDEVIVADSTSVNLFKLVITALRARPDRTRILTDDLNFPSDIYVLEGITDLLGGRHRLEIVPSPDGIHGPAQAIADRLDREVALVTLSHTVFKSGYVYDMAGVTQAVHEAGGLMLWDLSHSVGSVPVDLNGAGADFAIGCTYKYLNGGPGAPAFLYVRRDLQERLGNPISGWLGRANPFDFGLDYRPEAGIRRFLTGTPPMLSLALIEPGVDLLLEAGMDRLRAKSVAQTEFLVELWADQLASLGFTLKSPKDARWRGSHVSLGHPDGLAIDLAMINDMQIIPDFRAPDNIRLGIAPLYTRFEDIFEAVQRMARIVAEGVHLPYLRPDGGPAVT